MRARPDGKIRLWPRLTKKDLWYGSAKLDNKLPQNVQNIIWSHKLHRENHENLESGINSKRKKLTWNKDPKMYFPRRCPIIHNCHDVTQPHTQKMHSRIKLSRAQGNINHLMYMDEIKIFAKNEKELETLIHAVRIYSQDIRIEFGIEKCAMLVMKGGKRHMTDGIRQD